MTETSAPFTTHQAEDYLNRPESCGPAVPVCDMRIVGSAGEALPPGKVGELWAKGPNVAAPWGEYDDIACLEVGHLLGFADRGERGCIEDRRTLSA